MQKSYAVNKLKQLIDLNGDSVNFEIKYKVTSKDAKPFYFLIVDQTTLDNTPNLEYKYVTQGEINGDLANVKNVFQNYFMVLKADEPCICDVLIEKKDLPKTPMQLPLPPVPESKPINWSKILLGAGAVAIAGYLLYHFSHKEDKEDSLAPIQPKFTFYSPAPSRSASVASSSHHSSPAPNPLLERLKKLNL
jgi:hypothetical protein